MIFRISETGWLASIAIRTFDSFSRGTDRLKVFHLPLTFSSQQYAQNQW